MDERHFEVKVPFNITARRGCTTFWGLSVVQHRRTEEMDDTLEHKCRWMSRSGEGAMLDGID